MKTIKFYVLIDPRNDNVKYVGKTIYTLSYRLSQHISEAKAGINKSKKISWIQNLLNNGLKPTIELIEEIPYGTVWEWIEEYWINQFKAWGFDLLNMTNGGEGNHGQYFSKESIEKRKKTIKEKIKKGLISYKERALKMSIRMKGRKLSTDTKEKLRKVNLGKKYPMKTKLKKSKAVFQYTLDNKFVKEYWSLNEASRQLGISKGAISNVCKGKQKTAGGFKWEYK